MRPKARQKAERAQQAERVRGIGIEWRARRRVRGERRCAHLTDHSVASERCMSAVCSSRLRLERRVKGQVLHGAAVSQKVPQVLEEDFEVLLGQGAQVDDVELRERHWRQVGAGRAARRLRVACGVAGSRLWVGLRRAPSWAMQMGWG